MTWKFRLRIHLIGFLIETIKQTCDINCKFGDFTNIKIVHLNENRQQFSKSIWDFKQASQNEDKATHKQYYLADC